MPQAVCFEDMHVGDELPALVTEPVTQTQLVKYAGASGDFNPLHYDDQVGRAFGLDGVIAHGMLVMAFAGRFVTQWTPQETVKKFNVRFLQVTRPGESIRLTGKVVQKFADDSRVLCELEARSATGESVKMTGSFEVILPRRQA